MKYNDMYDKIKEIFKDDDVVFLSEWEDSIKYFVEIRPKHGILLAEDLNEFQKEFELYHISIKENTNNIVLTFYHN